MAVFAWEGRTASGEIRKGEMTADNDKEVMAKLRAQQITPEKVKKKLGSFGGKPQGAEHSRGPL